MAGSSEKWQEGIGVALTERMQEDYDIVNTYFGFETGFDVNEVFTNDFLDTSITMPE